MVSTYFISVYFNYGAKLVLKMSTVYIVKTRCYRRPSKREALECLNVNCTDLNALNPLTSLESYNSVFQMLTSSHLLTGCFKLF